MPFFKRKPIDCPAGEWTVLAETMASGNPRTHTFEFNGDNVEGEYKVSKGFAPFCLSLSVSDSGELRPRMNFEQGWFDVSYRIEVKPVASITASPQ